MAFRNEQIDDGFPILTHIHIHIYIYVIKTATIGVYYDTKQRNKTILIRNAYVIYIYVYTCVL